MMDFKIIFSILFLSFSLSSVGYAQKYIDIDLNPEKPKAKQPAPKPAAPKPPPKQSQVPVKKAPPKVVKSAPKPAPQQVAKPKPAPPVAKPNVQAKKILKPKLVQPPPKQENLDLDPEPAAKIAPAAPAPAPAPPTVVAPTPAPPAAAPTTPAKSELTLDDLDKAAEKKPAIVQPKPTPANVEQKAAYVEEEPSRFKNRHAFTVDYSTWYETLKIKNKATNALGEGNSHYFGIAFNYDFTVYREKYGYAITVGGVTGNAQSGTKDSGDYYERRIVWTGFRGGGRLFFRANNRVDLGLGFMAQTKSTNWPEEDAYVVVPQANPQYFYYIDTRWRLNYRYEIVQSFGAHLRSYALSWLLGVTYTLN
jgi:hypothetical protein